MTQWSMKLTERHEWLGAQVVEIAIKVHKALGPGLLEIVLDDALRLDILVDDLVVIELKAQENFNPI